MHKLRVLDNNLIQCGRNVKAKEIISKEELYSPTGCDVCVMVVNKIQRWLHGFLISIQPELGPSDLSKIATKFPHCSTLRTIS